MRRNTDQILDYAAPPQASYDRRIKWFCFISGAAVGACAAMLMLWMAYAGGPIFPTTVLFAPIAVVWEWTGTNEVLIVGLLGVGPLMYGFYALLFALPNRRRNLSLAFGAHALCFVITLFQRGIL